VKNINASLPLWYLHNTKQEPPHDIVSASGSSDRRVALLFSSKELGEQAVKYNPLFQAKIVDLPQLAEFLAGLEQRGFTHVTIDHSSGKAPLVSVADFRRALVDLPHRPD
jgi:hypothetical protein